MRLKNDIIIIYVSNDNKILNIYTINQKSEVYLENDRFISYQKFFSYKVVLDVLDEKVYINSSIPHGKFSMWPEWDKKIETEGVLWYLVPSVF